MPPAGAVTGLYGKLPAHGDFVRRALPRSFVAPWDAWLQRGVAASREALGEAAWDAAWREAPPWRFALSAGACGPEAVAGVLLPSEDTVGRRFPLTLAALGEGTAPESWFAALERLAAAGGAGEADADFLAASLAAEAPSPEDVADDDAAAAAVPDRPAFGWWTLGGGRMPAQVWPLDALPPPEDFVLFLDAAT